MKEQIVKAVGELGAIPFFPVDDGAQRAIMRGISQLVDTPEHLRWLVDTALRTMRRWNGLPELRGLYCTKFKPLDGIEEVCTLSGFSPADSEAAHAIEAENYKALPAVPMAGKRI